MDEALFLARLLLAAVFTVAGVAKLRDPAGTRQGVKNFGVPASLAAPVGVLLPITEIVVAIALVLRGTAWWGALGALMLLAAFIAAIAVNLARGNKPDCHCFGQVHSTPVGWSTLVRNGVLAAAAAFIVWQGRNDPGPELVSWLGTLEGAELATLLGGIVFLGLLALGASLLLNLLRQNGRLLLRIEALEERLEMGELQPGAESTTPEIGLPVGSPAPLFSLPGLYGETLTLEFLRAAGNPTLLFFMHPGCGPCEALVPEVTAWQRDHASDLTTAIVSLGDEDENRTKFGAQGLTQIMLEQNLEVSNAYEASGTPSAVLIDADGTIGSSVAAGAEQIRNLVARVVGRRSPELLPMAAPAPAENRSGNGAAVQASAPTAAIGSPAPSIELQDLKGRTTDLGKLSGSPTLLVFWNPGCGFCEQMLDELKQWEAKKLKTAPRLVVVSTGSAESNEALGFRSRVLLDQNFAAGSAFGANGTPMAVLLDADGKIASHLAAGAPAVMSLARGDVRPATA